MELFRELSKNEPWTRGKPASVSVSLWRGRRIVEQSLDGLGPQFVKCGFVLRAAWPGYGTVAFPGRDGSSPLHLQEKAMNLSVPLRLLALLLAACMLLPGTLPAQQEEPKQPSPAQAKEKDKEEKEDAQKAAALKKAALARKVFQNLQKAFQGDAKAAQAMNDALDELFKQPNLSLRELRVGMLVAQISEIRGDHVRALEVYKKLEATFANHPDKRLATLAKNMHEAAKKRLGILGKPLVLEGTLVDGTKLDWNQYKNKVVLVDFWATWCGPCRRELPNVLKLYKQYHNKGFEVVGVSLDTDKEALEKFIEENEIPWPNLFNHAEDNRGWNHPLAEQLGVTGIPHTILIGKDGKVLALAVRGQRLAKKLEELLGSPEQTEDSPSQDENKDE